MRTTNQDYTETFYNKNNQLLTVLCDGMGGHKAGDVASEMAVLLLGHFWQETAFISVEETQTWLETHINLANQRIYRAAKQYNDFQGMGTTLVTAAFVDDSILIGNIGDSRAYQLKKSSNEIELITNDHSFANELRLTGEITEEEAKKHHQRHTLTRSLGVFDKVRVDFFELQTDDTQLVLLCSDGLTNGIEEKEMKNIVLNANTLKEKAARLITAALENGSTDNVTVCLVELDSTLPTERRGE
ncbi:MAG: Stp1/IreP family PP2C-type Ser/Thr phosphatase [Alkalibacterium sp.]|nr:Stp1/IreP family PP2C-type Ser/Thr phosphatase [Alkalibacterium sp.]